MAKYNFDVVGSQLIVSLVPVLDDVQPTSMSYLTPSFKIGNGKINSYESGQPKQSFLFTEIGEIDGVVPTDLQDAFDKITALTANFNGGGTAPYKVYTALLSQSGTDAPVATVLENTLGGDVVWSRNDVGDYTLSLTGAFVDGKTYAPNITDIVKDFYIDFNLNLNYINLLTYNFTTNTSDDDILINTPIEIRVYN